MTSDAMNSRTRWRCASRAGSQTTRVASGFALIEVMVAVLLFAIGVLGLVGLQATMTQLQTDSKVRADAANLVDELAALMWADLGKPTVVGGTHSIASLSGYNVGSCDSNPRCRAWQDRVRRVLPGGALQDLAISAEENTLDENHGLVTVELRWTMPGAGEHKHRATFNVAPTGFN